MCNLTVKTVRNRLTMNEVFNTHTAPTMEAGTKDEEFKIK